MKCFDCTLGQTLTNSQSIYSGAEGVFAINQTSGCITLKVYPADLKRELFNIKVKVKWVVPLISDLREALSQFQE